MNLEYLIKLGQWLCSWLNEFELKKYESEESQRFSEIIGSQHSLNNWHSEKDIIEMLSHLCDLLRQDNLEIWVSRYSQIKTNEALQLPVLVKLNFNHSFAGIHEWLCCIITQSPFILNAQNNQFQILKFLSLKLIAYNQGFSKLFDINELNTLKASRFIIHTEKKNDSLYKYFDIEKAIIIEPKPTVGIITGNETQEDFVKLGKDIFIHLGQTSKTLRKLYIPAGFDIKEIISALEPFSTIYQNNKYANNYDYHQSVFLMERIPFLDNGFLIFKEDSSDIAPTGCLFYEFYSDLDSVVAKFENRHKFENIISNIDLPVRTCKLGTSHFYNLWNYDNDKDLIEFLLNSH